MAVVMMRSPVLIRRGQGHPLLNNSIYRPHANTHLISKTDARLRPETGRQVFHSRLLVVFPFFFSSSLLHLLPLHSPSPPPTTTHILHGLSSRCLPSPWPCQGTHFHPRHALAINPWSYSSSISRCSRCSLVRACLLFGSQTAWIVPSRISLVYALLPTRQAW